jgi:hypothetical protein
MALLWSSIKKKVFRRMVQVGFIDETWLKSYGAGYV